MAIPSLIKQKLFPRALLLLTLILTCALQSRAGTVFTYNGLNYTTLTDNTCETTEGYSEFVSNRGVSGDIVIPETVYDSAGNAYTVTSIGKNGFYGNTGLTSITLPSSLTSIANHAFGN
jgi:hypothetical protein